MTQYKVPDRCWYYALRIPSCNYKPNKSPFFKLLFFFWRCLGFELRVSCLLGKCSITWTMPSVLFALVTFQAGSCTFYQASVDCDLPTDVCHIAGITEWTTMPGLLKWRLANFLSGLVLKHNPPNLCLLNIWDYRYEPPCLAVKTLLYMVTSIGNISPSLLAMQSPNQGIKKLISSVSCLHLQQWV
jgi:hypothetical protein